ncbi:Zn-ribbon domain-containing OB-fold protein [Ramlibacter sp.]|uniref:Zn-ribbon domain-containing OB-fold protein n=1 Tax=Ramlibacter sp. TaxID=1917967 RepID=UPI003D0C4B08
METRQDERSWALPGTLARDGEGHVRLVCGRCTACGWRAFPRPPVCANCWSEQLEDHLLPRNGTLYAYSVVHRGREGWDTPYVIGVVDFDGGAVRVSGPVRGAGTDIPLDVQVVVGEGRLRTDKAGRDHFAHQFTLAE